MRGLALFLALLAVAATGCAGGSDNGDDESSPEQPPAATPPAATGPQPPASANSRLYTKSELAQLALQPSEAPSGMRYTKTESGSKTLEDVGLIFDTQTRQLRRLGFAGLYDAVFDSTNSDLRLALRLWLFRKAAGASGWLEQTRGNSQLLLAPLSVPSLADGSWAAQGNLNGSDVITHAFRAGNLVVVMTFSAQQARVSAADALAAAQRAVERIGKI